MENLPLQVAHGQDVVVENGERPHASGGQVECRSRAQTPGAHQRDMTGAQTLLPPLADLGQGEMACVTLPFRSAQAHGITAPRGRRRPSP